MNATIDEPVEVVAYDPRLALWFADDAAELRQTLGPALHALEHFGSTSVPLLAGKPIIDILVAPMSWPLRSVDRRALSDLGYEYLGEAGVPGREHLRRRATHATNLAVVPIASQLWHDNLALRDYLLANPDIARKYGETKRAAWEHGARTLLDYSLAKQDHVDSLVFAARRWRLTIS